MANTGFFFTDPVAAQQAVQMFQLEQAARDASRRAAGEDIRTFAQRDIARENAAGNRAIREAELAQNQRQFDATQDYRNRALAADEKVRMADIEGRSSYNKSRLDENRELELAGALESEINSQDPPTLLEFENRSIGLSPQRKTALLNLRNRQVATLNKQAGIAEDYAKKWNNRLAGLKPNQTLERKQVLDDFEKSKDRNFIILDPDSNTFRSLISRPRQDPVFGPEPAPAAVDTGIVPIEQLRQRVASSGPSLLQRSLPVLQAAGEGAMMPFTGPYLQIKRLYDLIRGNPNAETPPPVITAPPAPSRVPVGINAITGPVQGPPLPTVGPMYGPEPEPPPMRLLYPEYLTNGFQPY